jgi:hypothetical protein
MDPSTRMTRARAGSLPGATSAALDVDLRDGGRSGSQTRGAEVDYSGRTSPTNSSDESTPETVDSLAHRGDSDKLGRVLPPEKCYSALEVLPCGKGLSVYFEPDGQK